MIPEGNMKMNVDRFSGFEDIYDQHRPQAPQLVIKLLTTYLNRRPELVLDLGCGTGLSTFIWEKEADRIIGVEPNQDMIGKAKEKLSQVSHKNTSISFIQGYSNQLDIQSNTVDVITCSQSFHWMEPQSTLREAARVLREGGIFATYDCDWPPTVNWSIEAEYIRLMNLADEQLAAHLQQERQAKKWNKEQHLQHMEKSGEFRYTKEITFHNMERCNADRYVGLAMSQGGLQTVFKLGLPDLNGDIQRFRKKVEQFFSGRTLEIMFSYRMRVGVK